MKPIWPIIGTFVWGLALFPSLAMALFSPMLFDAPGSEHDRQNWIFFWSVVSFPAFCVVAIAGTWILWAVCRQSPTPFARALPAIVLLLPVISLTVFALTAKW